MERNSIIIADSDAFIAILNKDDDNHSKAINTLDLIIKKDGNLYFPATMISEVLTTIKIKLQREDLIKKILTMLKTEELEIYAITKDEISIAMSFFESADSKKNTFFDAVIAACAKNEETEYIFSFDKWYKQAGFVLVSDII